MWTQKQNRGKRVCRVSANEFADGSSGGFPFKSMVCNTHTRSYINLISRLVLEDEVLIIYKA